MTLRIFKTRAQSTLKKLWNDEEGGELLEYALIAGLIVIAAIAAVKLFAGALSSKFSDMSDTIEGVDVSSTGS